ncbi:hypothetical protein [Cupriavidus sp. UYPR2.512]|uniref:hypothetical protein n=1 Tax=Cupriavidus sp. UYPR2.512 TaxID=1080187 RepID=UPI0012F8E073|nr:hypothetical protein [Cupriavidus sp. UYPR2.512]UIF91710.1 hypothetical protein KAF44_37290 [Cupriavidus necator]
MNQQARSATLTRFFSMPRERITTAAAWQLQPHAYCATNGAGMVIAHAMHSNVLRQGAKHAKPTSHQ